MSAPVIVVAAPDTALPPEFDVVRQLAEVIEVRDAAGWRRALDSGADAAFLWDYATDLVRSNGPGTLGWLHTNSIGIDAFQSQAVADSPVVLTNTRGVFEPPIGEFVLMALLYFAKDVRRTIEDQRTATWRTRPTETLRERRVVVLGAGGVGQAIVTVLRALGIDVEVVARRRRTDPELGEVKALSDLDELLPRTDDLVVALPLSAGTRGLIDGDRLALLPRGARVVNVGRGPVVDETALIAALNSGHLGGAALDVFDTEPLPAEHPFWSMDNVLVSPHMSSEAYGWERQSVRLFLDNLQRWRSGQSLRNVVDKAELSPSPKTSPTA